MKAVTSQPRTIAPHVCICLYVPAQPPRALEWRPIPLLRVRYYATTRTSRKKCWFWNSGKGQGSADRRVVSALGARKGHFDVQSKWRDSNNVLYMNTVLCTAKFGLSPKLGGNVHLRVHVKVGTSELVRRSCFPPTHSNPRYLFRRCNGAQKGVWSLPLALSGERVEVPSFTTVVIAHLCGGKD